MAKYILVFSPIRWSKLAEHVRNSQNMPVFRAMTLKEAKQIRSRKSSEFIICRPGEVKLFRPSGTEICFFRPSGLRNAEHVAFDVQNNLYVADIASGTIFQMSNYSYRNYRTLIRGLNKPCSTLFNSTKQTLIIGCAHDDIVYEYQFTMT